MELIFADICMSLLQWGAMSVFTYLVYNYMVIYLINNLYSKSLKKATFWQSAVFSLTILLIVDFSVFLNIGYNAILG